MDIIYHQQDGYYAGDFLEIEEGDGAPLGWTRTTPPDLAEGEYATWVGHWLITTEPPPWLRAPQPAPVPEEVSRFQARAALLGAGLLSFVEAAIAASGNPLAQLAWADAQTFRRDSPTVAAMSAVLGLTDAQLDDLFRSAAGITA